MERKGENKDKFKFLVRTVSVAWGWRKLYGGD
jgi:hypothetical protein